jgi:hypothetical protein
MSFKRIVKLCVVIVFVLISQKLLLCQSYSNVYGKVVDEESKKPVANVNVSLNNVFDENNYMYRTLTNESGEFVFNKLVADDFEYELRINYIENMNKLTGLSCYDQTYKITFKLEKGKNLVLKPVKLKKGAQITGVVKLFDGTILKVATLYFNIVDKNKFDSINTSWQMKSFSSETGVFDSLLLPVDVDIKVKAMDLFNKDKNEAYDNVENIIKINKGEDNKNIEIIVPNILTEIKGRIVNKMGVPLANQEITINPFSGIPFVKTDQNGCFLFKYFLPREVQVDISYSENGKYINSFKIYKLLINLGESTFLDITLDSNNYFQYKITKTNL